MTSISPEKAKTYGIYTLVAGWLAFFCLFGYRSSFSVMQGSIIKDMGWTATQASMGYCVLMTVYAITAFFSASLVDRQGPRASYFFGALTCFLGFFLTSLLDNTWSNSFYIYLITYGLFAGIGNGMLGLAVPISIRRWYVGDRYGTAYGWCFMGAPLAQLLLTLVLKPVLISAGWQMGMKALSFIMVVFLVISGILARRSPEDYGVEPHGAASLKAKGQQAATYKFRSWKISEAFGTWALWGILLAFLTSMTSEFLVWSQLVSYFTLDMGFSLSTASNLYMIVGIVGLFTFPGTGKISDRIVKKLGNERKGRKLMLIISPALACIAILLLFTKSIPAIVISMILLSTYWAIQPGGCAGYCATFFGGPTFGKVWGLTSLIVMGIGPSTGTFLGAYLKDLYGNYTPAFILCFCGFLVALLVATMLPLTLKNEREAAAAAAATAKA